MHKSFVLKYLVLGVASIIGYGAVRIAFGDRINEVIVETVIFGLLFSLFFALYELWERRKAKKLEWLKSYNKSFIVSAQNRSGKLFLTDDQFVFRGNRGRYHKVPLQLSYSEITKIDTSAKGWAFQSVVELKSGRIRFNFFNPDDMQNFVNILESKT